MSDVGTYESIDGIFVEVPARMKRLKRDGKNCPIAYCAEITDGKPRLDPNLVIDALLSRRCWVCFVELGANKAFLDKTMAALSRKSTLPPAHLECILFMSDVVHKDELTLVYVSKKFEVMHDHTFRMGEPEEMFFRYKSREATAEEIAADLEAVMPSMLEKAGDDQDAIAAVRELEQGLLDIISPKMKPGRKL